jgi:hypothetical protein
LESNFGVYLQESALLKYNSETQLYVDEVWSDVAVKTEQIAILETALSQAREACAPVLPHPSSILQDAGPEAGYLRQRQGGLLRCP